MSHSWNQIVAMIITLSLYEYLAVFAEAQECEPI